MGWNTKHFTYNKYGSAKKLQFLIWLLEATSNAELNFTDHHFKMSQIRARNYLLQPNIKIDRVVKIVIFSHLMY